jgi:hypothetical protein
MSDMRQDDRVSTVTFTLPAGHQWTSVEAALREAHDREYELRMAFFWRCQYLEAKVAALTKAGDAMDVALNLNEDVFDNHEKKEAQSAWRAAKEPETR